MSKKKYKLVSNTDGNNIVELSATDEEGVLGEILEMFGYNLSVEEDDDDEVKTTEILQHTIAYWYRENYDGDMDEADVEHITKQITNGYIEGELATSDKDDPNITQYGWWRISND